MPPDTTRAASSKRSQRKVTEEELKDIELKRIRGELSCAECRRLKLRCDKKVPCGSCCRRGCESICPCGILSAGQGTRFILADTEHLHKKIADMSHRIRQLEDALAILQATVSDQRHPLLEDELLKVKFGPEATDGHQQTSSTTRLDQKITQSIDALGTLTLGDAGEVKYFGRSAGSETLMVAGEDWDDDNETETEASDENDDSSSRTLSPEVASIGNLFPSQGKRSCTKTLPLLEAQLPTQERAWALGESYLLHAANFFRPIKREELFESFLPGIYNAARAPDPANEGEQLKNTPHALATLFFLFAMGALLDLSLPAFNDEAEHYYDLARTALSLRPVFDAPQVDTIQALGLMATYHCLAGKKYSRDSAWCIMGFAVKLAQGIGLHRDSARWNMDAKTVQKRRTLFWEVFTADVSHSLALGRPPAMHLSYVDCEFPIDEEANLSDTGEIQNGFWQMKYTFGRDMFLAVSEATLVAKAPDYATVLELDRKVREVSFPTSFKPYVSREDGEDYFSSSLSLQGFYASQHRTVTMIYLHRSFFAQAMLDYPANPLLSPFAPSFLTAYRCASVIIKASAHQFDRCAEMAMRAWFLMYHTFSASIIVGTVVTRSPNSNVASSALQDLSRAVDLFERTAVQSPRAKVALNVLQKLKAKAIRAYNQYNSANPKIPTQPSASVSLPNITNFSDQDSLDNGDDELAIFGGQTRVIARKARSGRRSFNASTMGSSSGTDSPSPSAGVPSSPPMVVTEPTHVLAEMTIAAAEVHPALVEYLGSATFDGGHGPVSGLSESIPSSSVPRTMSVTDTTRGNSIGIPAPRRAPEERTSFSAAVPAPEGRQHPEELRRQVQVPEDVFESFMGYMPNRVMHNPTSLTSSSPINSTAAFSFPNSSNMHQAQWRPLSPDMNGLPKPDTSFDWLPRLSQQQKAPTPPPLSTRAILTMYDPQGVHMQDSPMLAPELGQGQYSGLGTSTHIHSQGYSSYEGYDPGAAMVTDPTNTLLELGIMTGSDIDSGWLSFMQECGIMDTSSSGAPASSS